MKSNKHKLAQWAAEYSGATPKAVNELFDAPVILISQDSEIPIVDENCDVPCPPPFEHFFIIECPDSTKGSLFYLCRIKYRTINILVLAHYADGEVVPLDQEFELKATEDWRFKVVKGWDLHTVQDGQLYTRGDEDKINPVHIQQQVMSVMLACNAKNTELTRNIPKLTARDKLTKNKDFKPKPFYTINLSKEYINSTKKAAGGSHRSPVTHVRRSHFRKLSDGRNILIPSTIVNAGKTQLADQTWVL